MNIEEKKKALDGALKQIEKSFGKGSVMKLGESQNNMSIETFMSFNSSYSNVLVFMP